MSDDDKKLNVTYHAGPNDPCPCGSGKKFKKCHAAPRGYTPPPPLTPEEREASERRYARSMNRLLPILAIAAMAPPIPPMQTRHPGQGKYGGGRNR